MDPIDFAFALRWQDVPPAVMARLKLSLLDLLGVACGGLGTRLSAIIRDHAAQDLPGPCPMLLDDRRASVAGAALAAGMTIDALDGHDGYNPSKGHIGAPTFPAVLMLAQQHGADGRALLEAMAIAYEIGARAAEAQHASVPDYHTSGSWGAVAAAAAGARLAGLSADRAHHALGIAEYHGPRSPMMRCIDFPTMVKDGAGIGAMTGVQAVQLAARGFTGAPCALLDTGPHWSDLGEDWRILRQYFKPYPVCRWAQAPVEAVLALRARHGLSPADVDHIRVDSFHEAIRLATARPRTTEEAQYSTSFPCAVALVRGTVSPGDLDGAALDDTEVLRLSQSLVMHEHDKANAAFPLTRYARVTLYLRDGRALRSDWHQPRWDHDAPPSARELTDKFHALADPVLGAARARALARTVDTLETRPLSALTGLVCASPDAGGVDNPALRDVAP